jgi:alkaline phosphatase D
MSLAAVGGTNAVAQFGHSVHADVGNLEPGRWYFYRFHVGPWTSPVGRTRTAPAPGSAPAELRFATAACQNWKSGFYTAHANLAQEDLDLVVFLGDYIYESGVAGEVRDHDGPRPLDLTGYRNRHALYKSDLNLQAAHLAFPWIVTWDDHEVGNNYAGDFPESPTPVDFLELRAAAYQAWWEHTPVRLPPPAGPDLPIFRRFDFGDLLSLPVLDTRQYRTDQQCGGSIAPACPGFPDPAGEMIGAEQEAWLLAQLGGSGAIWNALAQGVVFSPTPLGTNPPFLNHDQWDGYPLARRRILDFVRDQAVRNFVVLTGDIHASGAGFIPDDVQALSDPLGSELVATGISSVFDPGLAAIAQTLIGGLPHVAYFDAFHQGYVRHTLSRDEWRADFRLVETVFEETSPIDTAASLAIADGVPGPQPA